MKKWFIAVWAYTLLTAFSNAAHAEVFDPSIWDGLLKRHVVVLGGGEASRVDYAGMAADRSKLQTFLRETSSISQAKFDTWSRNAQLAFLINVYNAWTVELILTKYPDLKSIKDLGGWLQTPWQKTFIPLLGETRSLDDIEHGLIRGSGRYDDPRVHFAVNCASVGCPALRAEAYTPGRLDTQLDDQTRKFLSDRSRNRIDGDAIEVSPIFKWYREDFEKGWHGWNSLSEFLEQYGSSLGMTPAQENALRYGDMSIGFMDYDWSLNDTHGVFGAIWNP
ncbi:putative uncharacterized protein [Burkholderiales bacterium GJ-E10]|nr:putative uncharacterized protein [Burkholderiales bacterium GJ-E10]